MGSRWIPSNAPRAGWMDRLGEMTSPDEVWDWLEAAAKAEVIDHERIALGRLRVRVLEDTTTVWMWRDEIASLQKADRAVLHTTMKRTSAEQLAVRLPAPDEPELQERRCGVTADHAEHEWNERTVGRRFSCEGIQQGHRGTDDAR